MSRWVWGCRSMYMRIGVRPEINFWFWFWLGLVLLLRPRETKQPSLIERMSFPNRGENLPGTRARACKPSIWKCETQRSLQVQGQPGIDNGLQARLGYRVKHFLKID